jgi:transcriptional regulator with XRE-family HTH domain
VLKVRELRERHSPPLSQEALARLAGVSTGTIRRTERTGRANSSTLSAIARALGVDVGALFNGEVAS